MIPALTDAIVNTLVSLNYVMDMSADIHILFYSNLYFSGPLGPKCWLKVHDVLLKMKLIHFECGLNTSNEINLHFAPCLVFLRTYSPHV